MTLSEAALKYYFGLPLSVQRILGTIHQNDCLCATVNLAPLWRQEPLSRKLYAVFTKKWIPEEELVQRAARAILMKIFGGDADFGEHLFRLMHWHNSQEWKFDHLTDHELKKSAALSHSSVLTRQRYEITSQYLTLKLNERMPEICTLVVPMVVKLPVISVQYYLDLHSAFAFNSIKKSGHKFCDDMIDYLYELLFLQQKIAISLYDLLRLTHDTENKKEEATFTGTEMNAITISDTLIAYLKASIEKIMVLVALTYNITGIESKKTHKLRMLLLEKGVPENVQQTYYFKMIMDFIASENIEDLNDLRTGVLHKKALPVCNLTSMYSKSHTNYL